MSMSRRRFMTVAVAASAIGATGFAVAAGAEPPNEGSTAGDCATNPATPKREFRAMWIASVVNIDWPSRTGLAAETLKAEYRAWLDLAQRLNHNAVIVQVRPTADAFWPSDFEPWSEFLTGVRGQDPGWDPLAFLVEESHARNLEFHAWFNPYRISMPAPGGAGADITKLAPDHPVRQHPDWAVAYPVNAAGSRLYYNPGIPEVRQFVQDAMLDAVRKYDIDAVHFDDYFYPYPAAGQDFGDQATYEQYGAGFDTKADWRRHNIDLLVQEMGQRIHELKPWVKFGISPFGIWRNKAADPLGSDTAGSQSYDANSANTRLWVRNNWLDYILPQIYWNIGLPVADYAKLVPWWSDVVDGTDVQLYIGQADYKIALAGQPAAWFDPQEMNKHIAFNRDYNVSGNVHFSAKDVRANRLGATDIYAAAQYSRPALIPVMPQLGGAAPQHPVIVDSTRDGNGTTITWRAIATDDHGTPTSYAIYRFDSDAKAGDCDFADADHLLATVRAGADATQSFTDPTAQPDQAYTYYVTALDRLWNESSPSPARTVR